MQINLYSIQTDTAYNELIRNGVLRGTKDRVDEDFLGSYNWLILQMKKRLSNCHNMKYPVWAWAKRPDLRSSCLLEKGTKGVLITLSLDPNRVLFSDFMHWHHVLNNFYLPSSRKDEARFDRLLKKFNQRSNSLSEELRNEILVSWERIFKINPKATLAQATFKEIRITDVIKVTQFTAR